MPQSVIPLSQYLPAFIRVLVQQHLSSESPFESDEIASPTADTPLKYLRLQFHSGSVELERPLQ